MKRVFGYFKGLYGRMVLGLALKIMGATCELMLPFILSHILGDILGRDLSEIVLGGCLMLAFSAGGCVFNVLSNRIAAWVSKNFAENMRRDLFIKTLRLSAAQTDRFTIPSLESRITSDTYHVYHFINMAQRMGIRAPIILVGGMSITLFMDAYLAMVMIAMLPFIFGIILFISKKGVPLYSTVQKAVDGLTRIVREDTQGIRVIKALSKGDYERRRFEKANKVLIKDETRAGVIMGSVHPIMNLLMNVGSATVIALSASRVLEGLSRPETVIAFMQYFTYISMSMMAVTRIFVMYTKCAASAKRIAEDLECEEDIRIEKKSDYHNKKTEAHIVFDNVSFSYKGKRNNLENISFELKRGDSLGIIGATGSGKSTLAKLLLRFYDTDKGGIYINGENIRTIPKDKFYKMFGSALQFDFLYADTIEENISFGRDVAHEDVRQAAEIAQADGFIGDFKEGYGRMLSPHGTNISGGQKQRVLISRAIAKKPEILILDDSSSALDYKTDAALRRALDENMKETTVVTVAQRVSSVKDCGLILVLDQGKIIGCGTHSELLRDCDQYREISQSQMGGAFVE
ncbi:MAG: ABC transporter ATP-binding protein [Clostridia bacterium]|nr:ABC transporter ATP-binding protein [Clostridia bacterium]